MPTTTVETPLFDPTFQRRVAKELTFWWRRHGVAPSHVVTRFRTDSGELSFLGPYSMSHPDGDDADPFAFVSCVLAEERDAEFRSAYARHVRRVLGPDIVPERVYVAIQLTDPANHFSPDDDWGTEENPR